MHGPKIGEEFTELGADQIKWLAKYNWIHLNDWRVIFLDQDWFWLYVGQQPPDPDNRERQRNLESDRYFYWPDDETS